MSTHEQLSLALEAGHAAAQAAADRADEQAQGEGDPPWSAEALRFLREWAAGRPPGATFLAEEVRHAAAGRVPDPPEPRAWGAVVLAAARRKLIRRVGYGVAQDPKSHGNPKSVWTWVGQP